MTSQAFLDFNPFGDSEPFPGETLVADGWKYRDFPKMKEEFWNELLGLLGDGNYRLITFAIYRHDGDTYMRGQMFIAPKGFENAKAWSEARKPESPQ